MNHCANASTDSNTNALLENCDSRRRSIRSFALRQGRFTVAQRKAMDSLWPIYGLDIADVPADYEAIFGRSAPLVVEIGFGNGETLAQLASDQPQTNFIGIEVHRPGVAQLLSRLKEHELNNVRIFRADAVDILTSRFADRSLSGVNLFFPDPWPKKRHHKRRLVNPEFISLIARKLTSGGFFHAATDWEDYAHQMLDVLERCELLKNTAGEAKFSPRPAHRPLTKFERRGQQLGHGVWDLIFVRSDDHQPAAACNGR
jgi:tRNA (guanine-N7-)-methyltransferase